MAEFVPNPTKCRRHGGRLHQENLSCSLGRIIEMSCTGMSVKTRKQLLDEFDVTIRSHLGVLTVRCRLVRLVPEGLFSYTVGLQFLDVSESDQEILKEIASTHRDRRSI